MVKSRCEGSQSYFSQLVVVIVISCVLHILDSDFGMRLFQTRQESHLKENKT